MTPVEVLPRERQADYSGALGGTSHRPRYRIRKSRLRLIDQTLGVVTTNN